MESRNGDHDKYSSIAEYISIDSHRANSQAMAVRKSFAHGHCSVLTTPEARGGAHDERWNCVS